MVVKKTWERRRKIKGSYDEYHDVYTGWFLLGIIPLFVERRRTRVK